MSSARALKQFGRPAPGAEGGYMMLWQVPADIVAALKHVRFTALGTVGFPARIYCNKAMPPKLEAALRYLIDAGLHQELQSYDGCYIIRSQRGGAQWSMHAWGLAVDVNAATNRLGHRPMLSNAFVACWEKAGFLWGGRWRRPDGMHFELTNF